MKANIGDIVTLGSYPQAKYTTECAPIEWRVLDVQDGKALLISDKILEMVRFNEKYADTCWACSILRDWMNGEFYEKAFTDAEKAEIVATEVVTPDNAKRGTKGGDTCEDKVFALSIEELEKYFPVAADRRAAATGHASEDGIYTYDETGYSIWWLRSPGYRQYAASRVGTGGAISDMIYDDIKAHRGARPALWVTID